jgi:hypothetical protein
LDQAPPYLETYIYKIEILFGRVLYQNLEVNSMAIFATHLEGKIYECSISTSDETPRAQLPFLRNRTSDAAERPPAYP